MGKEVDHVNHFERFIVMQMNQGISRRDAIVNYNRTFPLRVADVMLALYTKETNDRKEDLDSRPKAP